MINALIRSAIYKTPVFPDTTGIVLSLIMFHCGLVPDVFEIGKTHHGLCFSDIDKTLDKLQSKKLIYLTWARDFLYSSRMLSNEGHARMLLYLNEQRYRNR